MQGLVSDKTFHLKWNNHLQNLSQLFTTIYSSSALADVTLSCRDGTLKAHKLVLSACSPYFEQIFRDNPCKHPVVILKGIPFSEINLLVEFMYKGSVDVQELDLQSLMHTASELEIRGLAYEARDNAAQMLNVNLNEYPMYPSTSMSVPPQSSPYPQARTDVERLKQIHLYQQSMMRAEQMKNRRRPDEAGTHTVVNNILAAAAREMEEARHANARSERVVASIQTERHPDTSIGELKRDPDEGPPPKKRMSILSTEEDRLRKKKMTVRFQDEPEKPVKTIAPANDAKPEGESKGGIKVVQLSALQKQTNNDNYDSDEKANKSHEPDDEETDSNSSMSDSAANDSGEHRPHVCDVCDLRFQRASHLSRHRLTHTGERPFTCGGCGRSFARSDKLRVHTKICERVRARDDPTVDMPMESSSAKREHSEVMSGMVRTTHRESGHLVFTPSGDVMLPPRAAPAPLNSSLDSSRSEAELVDGMPPRRGRGRPRKTPLPLTPKIKKRRGRPPKTSLDGMDGCVLTRPALGAPPPPMPPLGHLMLKKKRGRPPKNYFMCPDGRPNENYNASNLPFGDFSYLTDMMYSPALTYSLHGVPGSEVERPDDQSLLVETGRESPAPTYPRQGATGSEVERPDDQSLLVATGRERTIDVSDSSTDEDEGGPRIEPEENVPAVAMETQIMTVGDCQIVKLPNPEEKSEENRTESANETVSSSTPTTNSVTITPITTVGDCTIRPVENNT